MDYVKDGTLTIQARTIKEVNSIDRVVVYADGCQREYLMPLPTVEERKEGRWVRITQDVGLRPHQYMCTECHRIIEYSSSESPSLLEMKYPYCHCGAKMKGE